MVMPVYGEEPGRTPGVPDTRKAAASVAFLGGAIVALALASILGWMDRCPRRARRYR